MDSTNVYDLDQRVSRMTKALDDASDLMNKAL